MDADFGRQAFCFQSAFISVHQRSSAANLVFAFFRSLLRIAVQRNRDRQGAGRRETWR
jgi:hypothetical protein